MSSVMITSLPQSLKCAAPATITQASFRPAMSMRLQRMSLRVHAKKSRAEEPEPSTSSSSSFTPAASDEPKDFWEGESWELFGKAASFALPVLILAAVGVGFFAAQTYNQDATVFLESPRSQEDTAKLYTLD